MSSDNNQQPEGRRPFYRRRWVLWVAGIVVALWIFGMFLPDDDTSAEDENKPAATEKSEPTKSDKPAKSKKSEPTKPEKTQDPRKKAAKKVAKTLASSGGGEYGIECGKTETLSKETVYLLKCKNDEVAVAVAEDKGHLNAWIETLDEELKNEGEMYLLVKEDEALAVSSIDDGKINLAWDMLGAEGERIKIGSPPFSD